ncbi:hypothetical protein KFU94_49560 [Chloroflexi bacterium TSY]|nr:hypothetical protein [Chloroflexi bacterium TSY]
MELSQDKFSVISLAEDTGIMTLAWTEATSNMTDEDFKKVNLEYANFAVEHGVKLLLVNVEKFGHRFGPELGSWRAQEVIPRYHKAGVTKMAFVHGAGFEGAPAMSNEGENFVTEHFALKADADEWLLS